MPKMEHGPWQEYCRALAVLRDAESHPTGRKLRFKSPRSLIAAPITLPRDFIPARIAGQVSWFSLFMENSLALAGGRLISLASQASSRENYSKIAHDRA
jgi:hypothetical protein